MPAIRRSPPLRLATLLTLGLAPLACVVLAGCGPSTAERARAGDPEAEYRYAEQENGGEVETAGAGSLTYVPAFTWLLRSAQGGYVPAYAALAGDYQRGMGTAINLAEALRWLRQGAAVRDPDCEFGLAGMFAAGEGVPADPVQGYAWMAIYAWDSQGLHPHSSAEPPGMMADQQLAELGNRLTPAQVDAGRRLATTWRPETATRPHVGPES
jgi:hypothetical protein